MVCTQTIFPSGPPARKATPSLALLLGLALCGTLAAACSSSSPSQPDGGTLCAQGSDMCSAGTQCTNSVCVPTCSASGTGCPSGFYCESEIAPYNVCSPNVTTDCQSDLDCPSPQSCALGSCVTTELRADGGSLGCKRVEPDGGPDGCSPDSICSTFNNSSTGGQSNWCFAVPHCGADGGCPVDPSNYGSVCNQLADGGLLIPGKERLCLFQTCVDNSHCPSGYECFHSDPASPLGYCSHGEVGSPCYTQTDCFNSSQCELDGGATDDGGSLGACF